jgi:hypothetical protein
MLPADVCCDVLRRGKKESPDSRTFLQRYETIDQVIRLQPFVPLVHQPGTAWAEKRAPLDSLVGCLDLNLEIRPGLPVQDEDVDLFRVAKGERAVETSKGKLTQYEVLSRERYVRRRGAKRAEGPACPAESRLTILHPQMFTCGHPESTTVFMWTSQSRWPSRSSSSGERPDSPRRRWPAGWASAAPPSTGWRAPARTRRSRRSESSVARWDAGPEISFR